MATTALTAVVWLATEPTADERARPGSLTPDRPARPAAAPVAGIAPGVAAGPGLPVAGQTDDATATAGSLRDGASPWAWPDPGFIPARADPFQAVPVERSRPPSEPLRLASPPLPHAAPAESAQAVPAPPPPQWRLLGRVQGGDGATTVYLADDSPPSPDQAPQAVRVGLVLRGGYRVESVSDRHVGLFEPQSETRARIELPDWPQSAGPAGGAR